MNRMRNEPVYDKLAAHYDAFFSPLERAFLRRWRKELFSKIPDNSRLLEIGAGTGLNLAHYPGVTYAAATELSSEMINIARKKRVPDKVFLVQSNAEEIPFRDSSFDTAVATLVLCSVERPQNVFKELKRVVKPGGRILLLEHVRPEGILGNLFDILNLVTVPLIKDHFNRRTSVEASAAGLTVERVKSRARGVFQLIECTA
jgi:phosphatidylethanolamine/phosphatidyl-N-methylethanolamine N-methyltransferase